MMKIAIVTNGLTHRERTMHSKKAMYALIEELESVMFAKTEAALMGGK